MTKAKIYTYAIPGDLEFVGTPLRDKATAKGLLVRLGRIEEALTRAGPDHSQEHLVAAVIQLVRAARQGLESGRLARADVMAEIERIEKLIREIEWRDGEPDRLRGVKWRPTGRKPSDLTKAIDAALKDLDAPGAKASTRQVFNHVARNSAGVLDPAHDSELSQLMAPPASVKLAHGDEIAWLTFQKRISARRKKMREG